MGTELTNDHRRLLGVAIAMAKADGVLEEREQRLIDYLRDQLHLSEAAGEELSRMLERPPTPEQIARWCVTDQDRLGVYTAAVQVAEADKRVGPEERALLDRLATLLRLSPAEVEHAAMMAKEVEHGR